jgi:hypothetical protein
MFENIPSPYRYLVYILMFPVFFQESAILWSWGADDEMWIMLCKRIFLLLPVAAVIFACWASVACLLTVIVRQERRQFVSTLFVTWWDLGRATFSFWGGFFRFVAMLLGWILAFVRLAIVGIWLCIQDVILSPIRAARGVGDLATKAGTPWIAVGITMAWCALEALVFTYVMTELVRETLSSLTGTVLDTFTLQIILYFMLLAFVVGSYAIVASLEQALKTRNTKQIALVLVVELVALVFEVLFLYREFVDAITPWFAQHAGEDFRLGVIPILMIATLVWAGIRGMTWFLFAAHGTPTIMAIIQRTGLKGGGGSISFKKEDHFLFIRNALDRIKKDVDWTHEKGDEMLSAFILPPLQIVAACINFATMLISARHLFQLPFKSYKDMLHADQLINRVKDDR